MKNVIFIFSLLTAVAGVKSQSLATKYVKINEDLKAQGFQASIETVQSLDMYFYGYETEPQGGFFGQYDPRLSTKVGDKDTVIEIMIHRLNTKKSDILAFVKDKLKGDLRKKRFKFKYSPSFYIQRSAKKRTASKVVSLLGGGLGATLVAVGVKEKSDPLVISGSVVVGSSAITSLVLEFSSDADLKKAAIMMDSKP